MASVITLIPARMQASRLPGKPLADIHGVPMIVHVWRRAVAAGCGRVVVATDGDEIAQVIRSAGGEAVLTRTDHTTGSDRIAEALAKLDPTRQIENVVNLQGDLPTLEPRLVNACLAPLVETGPGDGPDIATIAAEIKLAAERVEPSVVKVVATPIGASRPNRLRALYFTRATAPTGDGPLYHHIGIYAYRRQALERFVALQPAPLEQRERLEQLRALENGMRIEVTIVDTVPLGVDTPHDLERARGMLAPQPNERR